MTTQEKIKFINNDGIRYIYVPLSEKTETLALKCVAGFDNDDLFDLLPDLEEIEPVTTHRDFALDEELENTDEGSSDETKKTYFKLFESPQRYDMGLLCCVTESDFNKIIESLKVGTSLTIKYYRCERTNFLQIYLNSPDGVSEPTKEFQIRILSHKFTQDNEIQLKITNSERKTLLETDWKIPLCDIELVISQTSVTRQQAIKALRKNGGDIVNAIMELTM